VRFLHVRVCLVAILAVHVCAQLRAEDWPTYRYDRSLSGVTGEKLQLPLENVWQFRARHATLAPKDTPFRLGWEGIFGESKPLPELMIATLPISAAGDSVFFTSTDGRAVCLDAATGKTRWEFVGTASMNCTPTVFEGKVYLGNDDGYVYCLDAVSGQLIWKSKAASGERWFISFERMTSILPVRTNVLVDDGVAFFGTGVFPHDGMYVNAIDARTGVPLWRTACYHYGFAGHVFATKTQLTFPTELKGFHNHQVRFSRVSGAITTAHDPEINLPHAVAFMGQGAVAGGVRYSSDENSNLRAWKTEGENLDGGRKPIWNVALPKTVIDPESVVYAGGVLYALANDEAGVGTTITARNPENGAELWSARIAEQGQYIAIANGRLLVSTRQGSIFCFAPKGTPAHGGGEEPVNAEPFADDPQHDAYRAAAQKILAPATPDAPGCGVEGKGYALVLNCSTGGLAYELAMNSKLYVCAVFDDAEKAQQAREKFSKANMHSLWISVWHRQPGQPLPYSPNFADLIVSEGAVLGEAMPPFTEELARLQKPIRGIALIGGRQQEKVVAEWAGDQDKDRKQPAWQVLKQDKLCWARSVRPQLANAGGWTHPFGDPGNTMNSHDATLKPPLGVAWNGPPYVYDIIALLHRDREPIVPIVANGVMVCPVEDNRIQAWDAYNGRFLWQYDSKNIGQLFTTLVAGGDSLYIPIPSEKRCVRRDLWTGREVRSYPVPLPDATWGMLAASDDGKTIWGSGNGEKDWRCIFAIDTQTGAPRWVLGGPDQGQRFSGWNALADGRLYLVGGTVNEQQRQQAIADMEAYIKAHDPKRLEEFRQGGHDIRLLTTIDAMTGKVLYECGVDVKDCDHAVAAHAGVLILSMRFGEKYWGGWSGGGFRKNALAVYDGTTGKLLWKKPCDYRFLPVITSTAIYAEPWGYDLRTGRRKQRQHPISGQTGDWSWVRYGKQCGGSNGSEHFLFGRSMGFGYQDLLRDRGMYVFWSHRQSCAPDTGSGGGMMLKPPLNSGCGCPWSLPYTIAMTQMPVEPATPFQYYQGGSAMPARQLHLNFGAAGDQVDKHGNLWVHLHPRSNPTGLQLRFQPATLFYPSGTGGQWGYSDHGQVVTTNTPVENTDLPFVFDCAASGLKRCAIPITSPAHGRGQFTVRLGFAAPPADQPGQRVFDVRLNGKKVLNDFDIVATAGGANRAVWKQFDVEIDDVLILDLIAKSDKPTPANVPLINGLIVQGKKMLSLGLEASDTLWLGKTKPEETVTISLANFQTEPFRGTIAVTAPPGIEASLPDGNSLHIAAGTRRQVSIRLKGTESTAVGIHQLMIKAIPEQASAAGLQRVVPLEWLGPLQRHIVSGNDMFLTHPDWNKAWLGLVEVTPYLPKLPVSSGTKTPGDEGTAHSYLMFDLPSEIGEVRSAKVRLHSSPTLSPVQRVLFQPTQALAAAPGADYWGAIRRIEGRPNLNELQWPNRPAMAAERQPLRPVGWDPDCVEAAVAPVIAKDNEGRRSLYLAIEPTALNGPCYWNRQVRENGTQMHNAFTLKASDAPVLLLDCAPKPQP